MLFTTKDFSSTVGALSVGVGECWCWLQLQTVLVEWEEPTESPNRSKSGSSPLVLHHVTFPSNEKQLGNHFLALSILSIS